MNAREDIHPEATRLAVMASWGAGETVRVPLAVAASFALFELNAAKSLGAPLFNPVRQRFEEGATVLRGSDGTFATNLFVNRADVVRAIPLIERAGPLFLPTVYASG